ncbi:MAG: acyltransferase [Lachnospiraceae bacterium]|nr:acyltransferase [Lachnospiraceae bacterium]
MKKIEDNCFDVLRLIAAVIVMFSHSFKWMGVQKPMWMLFTVEGSVGVMMFFGISGFLTMASYERCVNNHESILGFYFKRILRIYPALLCSYAVLTLLNYFVYDINVFTPDYLFYLIKCVVWPANRAFLNGISNGVLWTLPCELIYYMLIPIISRLLRKVNAVGGIILILLFWTINYFDTYLTQYIPGTNFMFFLYEFLIGCFLYRWKEEILDKLTNKRFAILSVVAFGVLFYLHDFTNVIPARGIMHDPLFGIIVPFITIIVAFSFGKKRMKHDFSYGIYLYHMLIIYTLLAYGIKSAKAFPVIWIGTIGIAVLSSIFIEEKALKLKKYMPSLSSANHVRCLRLDNRKWRAIPFIIIICMLIVLYSGLVSAVSDASLTEGTKFILFQLVAMILVGYGMASVLIREAKSSIHYFAYSYFLGYCIHILNYFIALPFGLERSLPYIILLEVVASILLLVRNKPDIGIDQNKEEIWLCSIFLIIVTAIRYVTLFGRCLLPVNGRIVGNAIHGDQLHGVGNSIEATFGFPFHDFRWYTDTFFYHYFSKIQIAVINLVTDISMIHLENSYMTIQTSIMLVVAFYVLLDNLKIKRNIKVWSFIAVFLTTGYEYIATATYSGHLYVVPTSFDIGLAFAIMVVAVFVDQMNKKFSLRLWIITMLFFAAGFGTKGPCIAVTMFGMGLVCITWMIQKKYKLALSYGCGFIIIFVAIFFIFLSDGMRAVSGSGSAMEIGTWLKSLQRYQVSSYYFKMLDMGMPVWLSQIGLIAIWLFMVQPCAVFGVFPVLIYKWISKARPKLENMMLLAMLLFGITIVLISSQTGFSEMYFIMVAFPFSIAYIANNLSELKGNKAGGVCCIACIGALTVLGIYRFKEEITPFFIEGYNNLTNNVSESPGIDVPNTIRDDEYAAYLWIKDNTEKESLLVSNIYLLPNQQKNFITGCMTERHLWLDGWAFTYFHDEEINYKLEVIKNFYNGKSEELQSLREDGVDYIIHIKEITPDFQLKDEEAEIVYQNEGVVVYKI